jgi:hypothetical protein
MDCDVFIYYDPRINVVAQGSQGPGIVSRLVDFIKVEGSKKYDREISVSWDEDIPAGSLRDKAFCEQIASCRIFLAIVSPSWKNLSWTEPKWDLVWKTVTESQTSGHKHHIIPVSYLLDKGAITTLPQQIRSLKFKRFFQSTTIMADAGFEREADGLAQDIVQILTALDANDRPKPMEPVKSKVFLGFAFKELSKSRDRIRNELVSRGYLTEEVQIDFSWTSEELTNAIKIGMEGCQGAVHFLERNSPSFPGDIRPAVQIQCDFAKGLEAKLFNFFWTGELLSDELKIYPAFIKDLKYNNDPIGVFARSLVSRLERLEQENQEHIKTQSPSSIPLIWVVCEEGDLPVVPEIVRYFKTKGWAAVVPGFNAPGIPYPDLFQKENYFLFYWGQGEKDWCSTNYKDLVNARREGYGFRPPLAALVYNGQAKREYKEKFEWLFLKAPEYDIFNPQAPKVQEFIALVEGTFKTPSSRVRSAI